LHSKWMSFRIEILVVKEQLKQRFIAVQGF
jgi:hypothetical protein